MLNLTRGNPEKLEGKLVAYATLKDGEGIKAIAFFASYRKADLTELLTQINYSPQNEIAPHDRTDIKESEAKGQHVLLQYHSIVIGYKSVPDFSELDDAKIDIINAGEVDKKDCVKVLVEQLCRYMVDYHTQIQPPELKLRDKTHMDVPASSLIKYVANNYVFPLIDAREKNDAEQAAKIEKEFRLFSAGSRFRYLVPEICELIKPQMSKENVMLAQVSLRKMRLLANEEYEKAALYRDLMILEQTL